MPDLRQAFGDELNSQTHRHDTPSRCPAITDAVSQTGRIMFSMPPFVLDVCPSLLLKLRNYNNIGFHLAKMNAKQWLHCNYTSGAGGVSDQPSTFVQSRPPLNLHSAKSIAMEKRGTSVTFLYLDTKYKDRTDVPVFISSSFPR